MAEAVRLCDLMPGQAGFVEEVMTGGTMRRRLLDIGLTVGAQVVCVGRSPGGDPTAYLIRGAVIAIRRVDAAGIRIKPVGGNASWG